MTDYRIEAPAIIRDFLTYHETIQGHSQKTVDEYYLDLRNFFRYIKLEKGCVPRSTELDDISIEDVNLELIRSVRLSDIYAYMSFLSRDRVRNARRPDSGHGLQASTRARKVATIRSFYKYLTNKAKLLEESIQLLESVDGENAERDFCILTLFLNCGLRISELCGLNLTDVREDRLRVLGKGNKERIIYLNAACQAAIQDWLSVRSRSSAADRYALFITRKHTRVTKDGIHYMIKKRLTAAGLDSSKYSASKMAWMCAPFRKCWGMST